MDSSLILMLMAMFLLMEAFFSGSEIGVVNADKLKLRHQAAKGSRGARLALDMLEKPEWLLATTLVGTNIAIVSNTTLATLLATQWLGEGKGWVAILFVAPLIWVLGEIVPKSIFQEHADTMTPKVIFILKGASILFFPVLLVFTLLTRLITSMIGRGNERNPYTLREELDMMLQMPGSEDGDVQQEEKTMIRRMFKFNELRARDIMIPLIHVISIPRTATCGEALDLCAQNGHTRLPIYAGRVDNLIGHVSGLDLLGQPKDGSIAPFIRPVPFVPMSKPVEDLLVEFRKSGEHVAVVVGEFGGSQGIMTLEDILERVVGDIEDEYDSKEQSPRWVQKLNANTFIVSASMDIVALKEHIGVALPDGSYETLGGFMLERLEDIPQPGQTLTYQKMTFTVEKATRKMIQEVKISF
ncbi:hemolysin family protein [Magnetococcus sp. PR-3]|uniref:hemolysin family protein n=1 Tax=Magnetococcus sp. PR-3 TaxID=3120355 RepID=UPI002FCE5719